MPQPFYLGLNMAGTVSTGAYTAGVIDFLTEAMDAWYAARAEQPANLNDWTIPPHEVQLAVMAGASGGGITAALTAAALSGHFDHVHEQSPDRSPQNALFTTWVSDISLDSLLGTTDVSAGRVTSLLDSSPIAEIAGRALNIVNPLAERRPWVRDGLKVILTLTNLAGIPYAIEPNSDPDCARALYYADRRDFAVTWDAPPEDPAAMALHARGGAEWESLKQAAIATSAFPVFLAPGKVQRNTSEYNHRRWRVSADDPQCEGGACQCETDTEIHPAWGVGDGIPFETLNVDGGATNNSPFDCARLELSRLTPAAASGHNPRDPRKADRAVISIAPLSSDAPRAIPPLPDAGLGSVFVKFVSEALVSQNRIQGENLKLTSDPQVASRWLIHPTADSRPDPLIGSTLFAFGGFVAQAFREHDYQLGRRNCQQFLKAFFGLPWDNPILTQYNLSAQALDRLKKRWSFSSTDDPASARFPLIPLLGDLQSVEVKAVVKKAPAAIITDLADKALARAKRIGIELLQEEGAGWFAGAILDAILALRGRALREKLSAHARAELQEYLEG